MSLRKILTAFVFFAASCSPAVCEDVASDTSDTGTAIEPLKKFASQVVSGNRSLLAAAHDLESSMFARERSLEVFSPQFYYSSDASKAANRSYNPITGLEEDYSTRRHGSGAGISQRTPLGKISYDYTNSKTEYSSSQTSYFQSLYLGIQSGLLRNDARVNALERRMAHAEYEVSEAQNDSVLLDVLHGSFQSLFNRMVVARSQLVKQQNLSFYGSLVEEAEVKLKNGIGSELDLKQASMRRQQAETGNSETELSLQETDRRLAAQLGNLTWDREIASFSFDPVIKCIPASFSPEILEETAMKNRPDYRVFLSQYKLQKAAFERARQMSRPDLTAQARWGKQGRGSSEDLAAEMPDKSWDVSLTYSVSFGPDGNKLDFAGQRERLRSFEARLQQKRDDIRLALADALERLEFHRSNLALLKDSEKLAAEVLEGQQLNFQLGKISLLDLTRYQQEFDNASLAVIQGEARLILEWLRLHYETGTLAGFAGVVRSRSLKEKIVPLTASLENTAKNASETVAETATENSDAATMVTDEQ